MLALADVVLGIPVFNFSATLVNSQLVCLPPVWDSCYVNLNIYLSLFVYSCPEKPQWGVAHDYVYILYILFHT